LFKIHYLHAPLKKTESSLIVNQQHFLKGIRQYFFWWIKYCEIEI